MNCLCQENVFSTLVFWSVGTPLNFCCAFSSSSLWLVFGQFGIGSCSCKQQAHKENGQSNRTKEKKKVVVVVATADDSWQQQLDDRRRGVSSFSPSKALPLFLGACDLGFEFTNKLPDRPFYNFGVSKFLVRHKNCIKMKGSVGWGWLTQLMHISAGFFVLRCRVGQNYQRTDLLVPPYLFSSKVKRLNSKAMAVWLNVRRF